MEQTWKAQGNEAFQSKRYTEAIEAYTKAILPEDENIEWNIAILCNRAFARLQIGSLSELKEAENDCSIVLKHDAVNVKALFRRALARSALCNYHDAKKDLEHIILLEPGHPQANTELDKIRIKLAVETANGMFNPEFRERLLQGKVSPAIIPPGGPLRLKSPRQYKKTTFHRADSEKFAEALRQCSLVAHEEAQAHEARDQQVAKAAWEELQNLEKKVTASTRSVVKSVKQRSLQKIHKQKAHSEPTTSSSHIKHQTDSLWAELMGEEASTCSVFKSKLPKAK